MKIMKKTNHNLKIIRTLCITFAAGLIFGLIITNLYHSAIFPTIQAFRTEFMENLKIYRLENNLILRTAFLQCLKSFLLIIIFSFSNINQLFLLYFMGSKGFMQGILLSSSLIISGAGGFIEYLAFLCPQAFLYVPAFFLLIEHCCSFNHDLANGTHTEAKRQLFFKQLPSYLFFLLLICIGNVLEAYVNVPILKVIFQ